MFVSTEQSAIILKESRLLMRSRKAFWFMLALLTGVSSIFLTSFTQEGGAVDLSARNRMGHELFVILTLTMTGVLGGLSALFTATSITTERENGTLDMLCATGLSARQIIWGKWFSSIAYQLLVIVLLLPVMTIVFQLGGVGPFELLFSIFLVFLSVVTYAMIGINISVRQRKSLSALVWTLLVVFFLMTGFPIGMTTMITSPLFGAGMILSIGGSGSDMTMLFVWFAWHLCLQMGIFIAMLNSSIEGLAKEDKRLKVVTKPVIKDHKVIDQRRKKFPYYLIDPLRPHDPISDRKDPFFIKEMRLGLHGRITGFIRLCYLALPVMFVYAIQVLWEEADYSIILSLVSGSIFLPVLFAPILSATLITREREQHTLNMLMVTPASPFRLVWVKFRVVLMLMMAMAACTFLLPMLIFLVTQLSDKVFDAIPSVLIGCLLILVKLSFYGSIGLCCSSFCRRITTSLALTYGLVLAVFFLQGRLADGLIRQSEYLAVRHILPQGKPWLHWVLNNLTYSLLLGLLTYSLLWLASWGLTRNRDS